MDTAERNAAIEEIKQVFARRVRAMDTKDWALYETCHADDAWSESYGNIPTAHKPGGGDGRGMATGKKAITDFIRFMLDGRTKLTTVHHAHMPEITFTSDTTAKGIWAMEDHLWWRNGDKDEFLHGYGHYHETYVKVDGRWLIQSRGLTRLRIDQTPDFFKYMENN